MRFDFGDSFLYNRPVAPLVARAAGNTALLASGVAPVGDARRLSRSASLPALDRGALPDARAQRVAGVCVAPSARHISRVRLSRRTNRMAAGRRHGVVDGQRSDVVRRGCSMSLRHLPLPALALALPMAATFERLQSQSMADAVHQPFVLAAIARGVPATRALLRHAWPSSLRPICGVYGLAIGVAALRLVHRRIRHRVAGPWTPHVRGAART